METFQEYEIRISSGYFGHFRTCGSSTVTNSFVDIQKVARCGIFEEVTMVSLSCVIIYEVA